MGCLCRTLFNSYTTGLVFPVEVLSVHVPVTNRHILHRGVLFRSPFKTFSVHQNTIHFLILLRR